MTSRTESESLLRKLPRRTRKSAGVVLVEPEDIGNTEANAANRWLTDHQHAVTLRFQRSCPGQIPATSALYRP